MSDQIKRRDFLGGCGIAAAALTAGTLSVTPSAAAAKMVNTVGAARLPAGKGPRLVVLGGGTSGLTIAKYAKRAYSKFDVVMVEKRDMYQSCFCSNLLYADLIDLEFLAGHSFLDAARNNDYMFISATAYGLDRDSRLLYTTAGHIKYDYLVVAPGIDYDYSRIGVTDIEVESALRTQYPGGFAMPTEHVAIKRKLGEFEGGDFIHTCPTGNYRCLPAPYERTCMMATYFKKHGVKGKVILLDMNPDITITTTGFHAAFDELYKDVVEYRPGTEIKGVDVGKKMIETEFDSIHFDDACIYPPVRASRLIENLGLMAPPTKSYQMEANVDTRFYNVIGDDRVYVTGDSRPHPYSKSANTSNSEGRYVAKILAARAQGKDIAWESPETICYSMVNGAPAEAISVDARYTYDAGRDAITGFSPDTKTFEDRDDAKAKRYMEWAKGLYRDMFA